MSIFRRLGLAVVAVAALVVWFASGAMAVVIYHFVPLDFRIITVANLTNAFAQSVSVCALALFAADGVRWERRVQVVLLTGVLAVAFMSHTSTFPILFSSAFLTAVLFRWRGGAPFQSPALAIAVAAMAALVLSVVLYYGHFGGTYRAELARIGTETASAAPDGGRGIAARFASVPEYLRMYLGIPALALAAVGGWALARRPGRDRLVLSTAAWVLSCVLFLALGILTPVDMRYYLASIPVVAVAGGTGASILWSRRGPFRLAAAVLIAGVVWIGGTTIFRTF